MLQEASERAEKQNKKHLSKGTIPPVDQAHKYTNQQRPKAHHNSTNEHKYLVQQILYKLVTTTTHSPGSSPPPPTGLSPHSSAPSLGCGNSWYRRAQESPFGVKCTPGGRVLMKPCVGGGVAEGSFSMAKGWAGIPYGTLGIPVHRDCTSSQFSFREGGIMDLAMRQLHMSRRCV